MGISHISILLCASSGTGKSYLASHIIMNAKQEHKIVIDYSNEYSIKGFSILELTPDNYLVVMAKFREILSKYKHILVRFENISDIHIGDILNTMANWSFLIGDVLFVCDEAHNYIPHKTSERVKDIQKIATQGRKYGVSSMFITQRPSLLNPSIRSNTNIKIVGRMTDGVDMKAIKDYIRHIKYVPTLPPRVFIYRNPLGSEYVFTTEGTHISHNG